MNCEEFQPVHSTGAPGGNPRGVSRPHDEGVVEPHLFFQQTDAFQLELAATNLLQTSSPRQGVLWAGKTAGLHLVKGNPVSPR